ncbi:MAG: DNA polymerase III subunit chi, partial [Pseudomonadota bacterium]
GQGWRVVVRGTSADRMEWLDQQLWLGPDDGFLPHGLATDEHADRQPILLTHETQSVPFECLLVMDGATVAPDEVTKAERVCVVFEAADESQMATARQQWAQLTDAGVSAKYWSQESGRWQLKVEKN